MAKKKKRIAHITYFYKYYEKQALCGIKVRKTNSIIAYSEETLNTLRSQLTDFERLCHKCKHIHKLNLAKVQHGK